MIECPMCGTQTENNEIISEWLQMHGDYGRECGLREAKLINRIHDAENDVDYYKDLTFKLGIGLSMIAIVLVLLVIARVMGG